ncbi:MAG TPA: Maf family protein [Gemmatimonadaceae bacterium]|jgi:septum formation protein
MNLKVILASASPRRRELLNMIAIEHDVIPAAIDESSRAGEAPIVYAERLAREKGAAVARCHAGALVISADTVVVIDDRVLGKPRDALQATAMLQVLSGRTHVVHTAVAVTRDGGQTVASAVESAQVTFRALTDHEIASYISTGEPMDKAGAYGIQGYGATIVERVDGDFFAVMGLPLRRCVDLLERLGVAYEFRALESAEAR